MPGPWKGSWWNLWYSSDPTGVHSQVWLFVFCKDRHPSRTQFRYSRGKFLLTMVFTQEHEELLVCAHHGLQKLEKKRFSIASDNLCDVVSCDC